MTTNRICIIGFAGCTIEPLDCGEMDNFALLGCLIGVAIPGISSRECCLNGAFRGVKGDMDDR